MRDGSGGVSGGQPARLPGTMVKVEHVALQPQKGSCGQASRLSAHRTPSLNVAVGYAGPSLLAVPCHSQPSQSPALPLTRHVHPGRVLLASPVP